MAVWPFGGNRCWEVFYESLTLNSAGTFFSDRKSGGGRCAEVTVIRGSTVIAKKTQQIYSTNPFLFYFC